VINGAVDHARTSRRGLLVALGVDNLGSGLFLPLGIVYITSVIGLPLTTAGLLVTFGTLVGLLAPPLAGGLVDKIGPKPVVVASQVLQIAGMLAYLLADGAVTVLLGAALVAAGTQTFYSAVFALIADVAPAGPKDRTFAAVEMVRSSAFGVGALIAAALLSTVDVSILRTVLVLNAASFLISGILLVTFVRPRSHAGAPSAAGLASDEGHIEAGPTVTYAVQPATTSSLEAEAADATAGPPPQSGPHSAPTSGNPRSVLANRPYLALIAVTTLLGLPVDFLLVGMAVYLRELAPGSEWAAGVGITALTATGLLTVTVVRLTAHWRRTTSMAVGGYCLSAWAAFTVVAVWLPSSWVGPWVLASVVFLAGGSLLFGTRVNALAEAAAPAHSRGKHLAAFQYSFTVAGLLAPLLVSAMAVGLWLPWLLVGAATLVGAVLVPIVGRSLPAEAVQPQP